MWFDVANNAMEIDYADDIIAIGGTDRWVRGTESKSRSNFGRNSSKVIIPGKNKMGLDFGAYRHPVNQLLREEGNLLVYTMVKNVKIDLGLSGNENQFTTEDIQFIGRVLTVAAFLEIPSAIGEARDTMKPIPNWSFSTHTGNFDGNDNGDGNAFYNEFIGCTLKDKVSQDIFFKKMELFLMLQAVSPRRYLIRKGNKDFSNTGVATKIISAVNEVIFTIRRPL